jgi:hypothetical protein
MVTLFKNFKIGMVAFGATAFMMVAGWQFGVSGTEELFSDKEVALENAIAGSIPADGCAYTGHWDDTCSWGPYSVIRCKNTVGPTTCAV